MPKTFDEFPVFFGDEEMGMLKHTRVSIEILREKQVKKQLFEKLMEICAPFKELNPNFNDFVKAIKIFDSRALKGDGSDIDFFMAPIADFADHSTHIKQSK